MIQSRCGMLCTDCAYREQPGCRGCTEISKPFWGDSCLVKSCCEGKGLGHCGQCPSFPCQALHDFSYDPAQGDEGRRILQCSRWREEETGA